METVRQQKVARLLQKELGDIFLNSRNYLNIDALITVTEVRVTADLSIAKVYVSIYTKKDKKQIFNEINVNINTIKKILYSRISKQLRIMPTLEFYIDETLDKLERIDQLLKKK